MGHQEPLDCRLHGSTRYACIIARIDMDHEPLPTLFVRFAKRVIAAFPMFILFSLLLTALDYFFPD
jgi:hypothetical protein